MTVPAGRPKRVSYWWWIALALVVVAGLAVVAKQRSGARGQAVTVEKAAVRTITQIVTATGKIQPETEVKISPEVYGEIIEMPLREGARVKKGQFLVRIKPDLYAAQVDQQTAAVSAAHGAEANSRAKLEKAEADLKRYEELHQRQLASDSDYVTYKTAFAVARAEYASAQAQVQQAEGFLKQAKDQLSKTSIYAPMDGTISSRSSEIGERVVATGQFSGTEIMRVADLSNMEVQVNVNENDVPEVKVGDHALITIDAYPDRKFNGLVKEIASSSENAGATGGGAAAQGSGSSSNEVTNFLVRIRVSDRDVQLRPGMSATADIETKTAASVVTVPIQSVTERDAKGLSSEESREKAEADQKSNGGGELTAVDEQKTARKLREQRKRVVFVRAGDKVHLREVVTGIADNTWMEIKSGVKPGEEIVSGTYGAISRLLKDDMKVYLEPPKKASDQPAS